MIVFATIAQVVFSMTYNLIKDNVQSVTVSGVGDATYQACTGFKFIDSTVFPLLYDGSVDINQKLSQCICGQSLASSTSMQIVLHLTTQVTAGVKTLILTSTHDSSSGLTVQIATSLDGSTYTTVCTACVLGTNDFSTANSGSGLTAFQYLRVIWPKQKNLCFCEVWVYKYKNYVPNSTITGFGSGLDIASVTFASYSTNSQFLCLKDQNAEQFYQLGPHTCIFNDKSNLLTYIVIDFAQPLVIKEFHSSGGSKEVWMYLIDPRSSLMAQTAGQMYSTITTAPYTKDLTNFVSYPSPTGEAKLAFSGNKVLSTTCSIPECDSFGTTRIVIANDFNNKDFFTCGFAIMAEPITCPPSADQCLHAVVETTSIPTELLIPLMTSALSTAFIFKDKLSTFCAATNVCGFTQTFVLQCVSCFTCTSGLATCGGDCGAYSVPSFSHEFVDAGESYHLSVTDDGSQQINHKCYIDATFNGQTVRSSNQINIKKTCGDCSSTSFVTTSVPNFAAPIPIGASGQSQPFSAFTDSVTLCGKTCSDSLYSVYCKKSTDTTGSFTIIQQSWLWSGAISGAGSAYNFYANTLSFLNHQKTYTCQLNAYQPDAGIFIDSASTFDVTFDLCINAAQSCPWDYWIPITSAWTGPSSFSVYLDGVAQSTSFVYTKWQNYFATVCSVGYCGTLSYQFIDVNTNLPLDIPGATVTTTIDTITQVVTLTVVTTSQLSAGEYEVYAKGVLDSTGIWTGPQLKSTTQIFTITVVDPCGFANPCQYTQVIDSIQHLTTMTVFLNNIAVTQSYDLMDDYISNLCGSQCYGQVYSLIDTTSNTVIPSDLAVLKTVSNVPQVYAKTLNYLYTGVHNVRIKCTQYGTTGYSLPFDIVIVACDTRSCQYTRLEAPTAPAQLPASYSIGVDNVAGSTTCALFTNTVGSACTVNPSICGDISYSIIETSTGLTPTFATLNVGTTLIQSAQTTDITLHGPHVVKIVANLDLSLLGLTSLTKSSAEYTITVDYCSPLPCDYNKLIAPIAGLPLELYVYTNGTTAFTTFPSYKDEVSLRCSNPYASQCGPINYVIEDQSGVPIPFPISVNYDVATSLWQISASNTDSSLVNVYQLQIHASFSSPPLSGAASDNTQAKFELIMDHASQCVQLNCTRNKINMVRTGYIEPSNITLDLKMTWNSTIFDSYNDTKTAQCWKQPGTTIGNVAVASWDRPVCGFPLYDVVDLQGDSLAKLFGSPNIVIEYYQDTEFTQQFIIKARTDKKQLAGVHKVRLQVKLSTSNYPQYSQPFYIIVVDPCNPLDCTVTTFLPGLPNPSDINIAVGQGYVTSKQGAWSNSISELCSQTTLLCGSPSFVLLQEDLTPVPFVYQINKNSQFIRVNVIITDESMQGQTYNVVLQGFGFNFATQSFYGQNGTSVPFQVIVGQKSVINPYHIPTLAPPVFETFPPDIQFITYGITQVVSYSAVAYSQNSTIDLLIVSLNNAMTMVDYSLNGTTIDFDIVLLNTTKPGTYKVDVLAIDVDGLSTSKQFTITAIQLVSEDIVFDSNIRINTTNPLTASITEITSLGFMTISYNRRVLPITEIQKISTRDFYVQFEQRSDEKPIDFNYTVVDMSPDTILVQLSFSAPLDVSQGLVQDLVRVYMLQTVFMQEDVNGIYTNWQLGDQLENRTLPQNRTKLRNYGDYTNKTVYYALQSLVPKQLASVKQQEFLESSAIGLMKALEFLLWGSFGMHILGLASMEYVWVICTDLQIIATFSLIQIQIPHNVQNATRTFSDIANTIVIPSNYVYNQLKSQVGDSEDQSVNIYGQKLRNQSSHSVYYNQNSEDRRLSEQLDVDFKTVPFVIESAAQMIVITALLVIVFTLGLLFRMTVYFYVPQIAQNAFDYLQHRIFWNFPLRMMIQHYLVLTTVALLGIKANQSLSTEQQVNYISSCIIFTVHSIGFLLFVTAFNLRLRLQLQDLGKKFDSLYLSVRTNSPYAVVAVSCNLLRKLLLVFVVTQIDIPIMQLFLANQIQLLYIFYLVQVAPMDGRLRNMIELCNELTLLLITIVMFLFTDYIASSTFKYYVGWVVLCLMLVQIVVDVLFQTVDVTHKIRRARKILRYKCYSVRNQKVMVRHKRVMHYLSAEEKAQNQKMKNPILFSQMDKIQEDLSKSSRALSLIQQQEQKPLTILQKKAEFEERMQEFRATDKVMFEQTSKVDKKDDEKWQWQQEHSKASDWDALPKGYQTSQMLQSVSLSSSSQSAVGIHNLLERSFSVNEDL